MFFFNTKSIYLSEILNGFYDIHSHLLPGVDDGASNQNHSQELLNKLSDLGVKGLYMTPHIISGAYDNRDENTLREAFNHFTSDVNIDIRLAAEYFIDDQFPDHIAGNPLTMHNKHILTEFSMSGYSIHGFDMLFDATISGYNIIIAHPERYSFLQRDNNKTINLIKQHKLQLNLLSLTGYHGNSAKSCAEKLLKDGYYTFAGTDVHSNQYIDMMKNTKVSTKVFDSLKTLVENNKTLF